MKQYCIVLLLLVAPLLHAESLTEVKLLLDWTPNTNHTGVYVALDKGWYADEGLDLTIIIPGEGDVYKAVAASAADFGVGYQEGLTLARAAHIPVVSIAAIIQHNTSAFASRKEKGITSPADFSGTRYGGFGSPLERPMIDALMQCASASVDNVRFIDIGWADFLSVTASDRIDFAWIFYGWTGIDAEQKGVELNTIMLSDHSDCIPDYYTPLLMTSESMINQNPKHVAAFLQATAKGYDFARNNAEQAAAMLLAANPELNAKLVVSSQQWLADKYQDDAAQWGWQQQTVWKRYIDFMKANKIISDLDVDAAFTNAFLAKQ